MDIFLLYLLTRLDAIQGLFFAATTALWIGGFASGLWHFIENEGDAAWRAIRRFMPYAIGCAVITALIPTKGDAMFIAAGAGVIEAAKSDTAKRLAGKSVQVIEDFLDKQLTKKDE
jgi:hypothetical protein